MEQEVSLDGPDTGVEAYCLLPQGRHLLMSSWSLLASMPGGG